MMRSLKVVLILGVTASLAGCENSKETQGNSSTVAEANKNPNTAPGCESTGNSDAMNPLCVAPTPSPNPSAARVTTHMSVGRSGHMAAVLKDGRVLVVGGISAPDLDSPAEIYDPATDTWSAVGTPIVPARHAGSMVVLNDGRVLIAGGEVSCQTGQVFIDGQFQNCDAGRPIASREVEIFDPADSSFHLVATSAHGRTGATLTLLSDGTVLLLGGSEFDFTNGQMNVYKDGDIYDPSTGEYRMSWMNMILARFAHTATIDRWGDLVIAGGSSSSGHGISRNELYSGHYARSTYEINPFLNGRAIQKAYLLESGEIVFFGGISTTNGVDSNNRAIEYFDGSTYPSWTSLPSSFPSTVYASAQLSDSRVLVAGGSDLEWHLTSQIFALNPSNRQFEPYGEMTEPRANFTLSVLGDGSLLVIGGTKSEAVNYANDTAERIY
jgi:N-acetylneuraminic acid mutarotase